MRYGPLPLFIALRDANPIRKISSADLPRLFRLFCRSKCGRKEDRVSEGARQGVFVFLLALRSMFILGNLSFSKTAAIPIRASDVMWGVLEIRSPSYENSLKIGSNRILHSEIAFDLSIRPEGGEEATLASIYTSDREKADDI